MTTASPSPCSRPGTAAGRKRRYPLALVLAGAGGAGVAAVIAIAALALSGNHSTGIMQAWVEQSHRTLTTPPGSASASASPSESPSSKAATASPSATPSSKPSPSRVR